MTLELIERLTKVFKDYCGVLTEESMKKNFTLIYELLDEVIVRAAAGGCCCLLVPSLVSRVTAVQDYGYPQGTSTELLKAHVYNEPIVVEAARSATFKVPTMSAKTTPSSAVHKPISLAGRKGRKNEIFVDILERLTVLFNSNVRAWAVVVGRPTALTLSWSCTTWLLGNPTGLHPQLDHRWVHSDEELFVRQPASAAGVERRLDCWQASWRWKWLWRCGVG